MVLVGQAHLYTDRDSGLIGFLFYTVCWNSCCFSSKRMNAVQQGDPSRRGLGLTAYHGSWAEGTDQTWWRLCSRYGTTLRHGGAEISALRGA